LLTEGDGPIYQLHRWYEQFYVDEADVTPAMRDRFQFELNVGNVDPTPPVHHLFDEP